MSQDFLLFPLPILSILDPVRSSCLYSSSLPSPMTSTLVLFLLPSPPLPPSTPIFSLLPLGPVSHGPHCPRTQGRGVSYTLPLVFLREIWGRSRSQGDPRPA